MKYWILIGWCMKYWILIGWCLKYWILIGWCLKYWIVIGYWPCQYSRSQCQDQWHSHWSQHQLLHHHLHIVWSFSVLTVMMICVWWNLAWWSLLNMNPEQATTQHRSNTATKLIIKIAHNGLCITHPHHLCFWSQMWLVECGPRHSS